MNSFEKKSDRLIDEKLSSDDTDRCGLASPSLRIAVYAKATEPPRVLDLSRDSYGELIQCAVEIVRKELDETGSLFPGVVAEELISNLVHSGFKGSVVSILDEGQKLIVSDRGGGFDDAERAFRPGFSTANEHLRRFIRGVGSGLSIAKASIESVNGSISVEGNLKETGLVVTACVPKRPDATSREREAVDFIAKRFSDRQKKILLILLENDGSSPSLIARELGVSISTVHRDLVLLDKAKVVESEDRGVRHLNKLGHGVIESLLNDSF